MLRGLFFPIILANFVTAAKIRISVENRHCDKYTFSNLSHLQKLYLKRQNCAICRHFFALHGYNRPTGVYHISCT